MSMTPLSSHRCVDPAGSPSVSVALCTLDGAGFLPQLLDSLMSQQVPPLEVVAVDDGSIDRTMAILESYARKFSEFRIVRNQRRRGVTRNFEYAFSLCRGPFIAPCDQDDIWCPEKLSQLTQAIAGCDLAYCDSELIDERGEHLDRRVSQRYRMFSGRDPRPLALANCVSGHAMLFRRDLLERAAPFPEGVYYDWWLTVNAAARRGVVYHDRPLVYFRQHAGGASAFDGRPKGQPRLASAQRTASHLNSLRALQGLQATELHREFFTQLWAAWQAPRRCGVNWTLFVFALRHRHALFRLRRTPPWLRWRHAFKYLWMGGTVESRDG